MIALLDAFNQYSLKDVVLIVFFTTLMLNVQKLHCKLFRWNYCAPVTFVCSIGNEFISRTELLIALR